MLHLFAPDYYIENYRCLDVERLRKQDIHVLVCDIDNTLVAHDEAHPDEEVKAFIKKIQAQGIEVILVSNNVEERVSTFAQDLHVKTYPFAKKPLKLTYKKMMKDTGYDASHIAVLGDQLLTDMLGGNRVHFYTILTKPVAQKDLTCTKINRIFENVVYWALAKSHRLVKGVYDDSNM